MKNNNRKIHAAGLSLGWILLIILAVLFVAGAGFGYHVYNKQASDIAERSAATERKIAELEAKAQPVEDEPEKPKTNSDDAIAAAIEKKFAEERAAGRLLTSDQVAENRRIKEEYDKLQKEKVGFVEEARKKAESEYAEKRAQLAKDVEETLPGEAPVRVVLFDPKTKKEIPAEGKRSKFETNKLPAFKVGEPIRKKLKVKTRPEDPEYETTDVRPVLTPGGLTLEFSGFVPDLEDESLVPYKLYVNRGSKGGNTWTWYWFAKPKG